MHWRHNNIDIINTVLAGTGRKNCSVQISFLSFQQKMVSALSEQQLPPGVFVDKQTSLLLAPALHDDNAAKADTAENTCSGDGHSDDGIVDHGHSNNNNNNNSLTAQTCNNTKLPRVQNDEGCYIEEDMNSLLSSSYYGDTTTIDDQDDDDDDDDGEEESELATPTLNSLKKKKVGKLQWRPPGMSKRGRSKQRKHHAATNGTSTSPTPTISNRTATNLISGGDSVYGQQSVITMKSAHTSFSSYTQKAGNHKRSSATAVNRLLFRGKKDAPQQSSSSSTTATMPLPPSNDTNNNGNKIKRSRRLKLLMQRQEEERLRKQDEEVKRQFDSHRSASKLNNNNNSGGVVEKGGGVSMASPTAVADINIFDEVGNKMKRIDFVDATTNNKNNKNNNKNNSSDERNSGPIDIDTCSPHLPTSTTTTTTLHPIEQRNLAAMHKLGYTHLRNNEIEQAITVFTEILRGQNERHGKHSLQSAMALHNLGVVYVKSRQYKETAKLCELSSKIRREELGKNHLDVAVSLAQMGVALMELHRYEKALVVFREALRIRRVNFLGGKDCNHTLIVRVLNNIGCALFELERLEEAEGAFEETLVMQRELMKVDQGGGGGERETGVKGNSSLGKGGGGSAESSLGADMAEKKKDSHHMLLSIALTLSNLGSIHLRTGKLEASFVAFEEALLVSVDAYLIVVFVLWLSLVHAIPHSHRLFDYIITLLCRFKNQFWERSTKLFPIPEIV